MTCMHDQADHRYYREDNGNIVDYCGQCGRVLPKKQVVS